MLWRSKGDFLEPLNVGLWKFLRLVYYVNSYIGAKWIFANIPKEMANFII